MARWRGGGVAAGGGAVPGRRLRPSSWRRRRRRRRRERRRRRRRCAAKRRRPVLRRHDNVDGARHSQRHGKQRLKQRTAAQRHGKAQQATLSGPQELQARDARQFIIKMTINKETRDQAWTADKQRRQGTTAASGRRIVGPFVHKMRASFWRACEFFCTANLGAQPQWVHDVCTSSCCP